MKNKKLIYILLPLVIAIWGLIILRFIKQAHPFHGKLVEKESALAIKGLIIDRDTSILILKYRDPFLSGVSRRNVDRVFSETIFRNTENLTSVPKAIISIPDTKYYGLVVNPKSRNKLGLMKIDNKDFLVQEGDVISGERVLKLHPDSVIISFKRLRKTIIK